jgi:NAD-dependent deacetylase
MKIVFCSGAGLSAESGVPTFRSSGGLWHKHDIKEVCDLSTFYDNYDKVHDFYNKRRAEMPNYNPNTAHIKISELSRSHEVINLTTNVDNLLERAGCDNVIHMHGIITEIVQNYKCENQTVIDIGSKEVNHLESDHFPIKPNVIFFNEFSPKYQDFNNEITDLTVDDVVVIIGSSEEVFPFVLNVMYLCEFKGRVIFVNPDKDLCDKARFDAASVYEMNATDFFENIEEYIPQLKK